MSKYDSANGDFCRYSEGLEHLSFTLEEDSLVHCSFALDPSEHWSTILGTPTITMNVEHSAFKILVDAAVERWETENLKTFDQPISASARLDPEFPDQHINICNDGNEDKENHKITTVESRAEFYWMDPNWIPLDASGEQIQPEQLRKQLRDFIHHSPLTKTAIVDAMGVNSNSFRKFMLAKYKTPWRATENGTYWAAARMLEAHRMIRSPSMAKSTYYIRPKPSLIMSGKSAHLVQPNERKFEPRKAIASCPKKSHPKRRKVSPAHSSSQWNSFGRRSQLSAVEFDDLVCNIIAVNISSYCLPSTTAHEVAHLVCNTRLLKDNNSLSSVRRSSSSSKLMHPVRPSQRIADYLDSLADLCIHF